MFYNVFGFIEFNKLCLVYFVGRLNFLTDILKLLFGMLFMSV